MDPQNMHTNIGENKVKNKLFPMVNATKQLLWSFSILRGEFSKVIPHYTDGWKKGTAESHKCSVSYISILKT